MPRFKRHAERTHRMFLAWAALAALGIAAASAENLDPRDLKSIEKELGTARERQVTLEAEAESLEREVMDLRQKLIEAAARVQARERDVTQSEERLDGLIAAEAVLKARLDIRMKELGETLAALQRLDRNPPPALAVKPGDALGAMRSAMILGTLVPALEAEAQELRRRLDELRKLRADIVAERETLETTNLALSSEQQELERLLARKLAAQNDLGQRLEQEREEVARLSKEARTLTELIEKLEARAATRLPAVRPDAPAPGPGAAPATPLAAPRGEERDLAALPPANTPLVSGPGRLFSKARGRIRLPAQGEIVKVFGDADGAGGRNRGISVTTRPGAQITAPFDGKIVFAGPFRGYGQLLILSVGEGYHLLFSGLGRIDTEVGQAVLAGEPLGQMSETRQNDQAGKENVKPALYIEFRRNGEPLDPEPWFASSERKARG